VTWSAVDAALKVGHRGLPGGSSLFRLMAQHREKRTALGIERILAWADSHHAATGSWPTLHSGKVVDTAGENSYTINGNLKVGRRGLPGGQSLAKLLAEHRGAHCIFERAVDDRAGPGVGRRPSRGHWPLAHPPVRASCCGARRDLGGHQCRAETNGA
jgi:hypothetical protein